MPKKKTVNRVAKKKAIGHKQAESAVAREAGKPWSGIESANERHKLDREDVNQAAFRVVRESTERE